MRDSRSAVKEGNEMSRVTERERMKPEFISALLENTESGSREKVEGGLMAVV